jgi:hypothetical protein
MAEAGNQKIKRGNSMATRAELPVDEQACDLQVLLNPHMALWPEQK